MLSFVVEDSKDGQIKLTTSKKLEKSIIEKHDANKDPIEEERRSITEEDGKAIVSERNGPNSTIKE